MKITCEKDIEKAMEGFLDDDFETHGNDARLFMKLQQQIADQTASRMVDLRDVYIYSILPAEYQLKDDAILAYQLPPGDLGKWYHCMCRANITMNALANTGKKDTEEENSKLKELLRGAHITTFPHEMFQTIVDGEKTVNKKLLAELQNTGLLFGDTVSNGLFIVSKYALPTLGQRIHASGDFLTEHSFARDVLFASLFAKSTSLVKLIIRKQDKIAKVFMATTSTYNELPLTLIEKLYFMFAKASGFTGMTCDGWILNHSISCIRFSFDNDQVVQELRETYAEDLEMFDCAYGLDTLPRPGIEVKSSDIGDCSFIVRGFWKFPHSVLYTEEVAKKHSGKFTPDDLIQEVRKTVFSKYTELPEALIKLLQIEVTPCEVREAFQEKTRIESRIRALRFALERCNPETDAEKIVATTAELEESQVAYQRALRNAEFASKKQMRLIENLLIVIFQKVKTKSFDLKKAWRDNVFAKFDANSVYTMYDIVSTILDTPFEGGTESEEKTQKTLSALPYLDYAAILADVSSRRRNAGSTKSSPEDAETSEEDADDPDETTSKKKRRKRSSKKSVQQAKVKTPESENDEDVEKTADTSADA